jgi:hypothetical protein
MGPRDTKPLKCIAMTLFRHTKIYSLSDLIIS